MEKLKKEIPRFKISAHVVKQLGAELVSDPVTALMELIKNAYDADSKYVKVTINSTGVLNDENLIYPVHQGYIIVEDGGCGMSEDKVIDSWLMISHSEKRAADGMKAKTPLGRTPLGDKGLGRLSTQRLANICEIYTKAIDKPAVHVGFDWRTFDEAKSLDDVEVVVRHDAFTKTNGTKIVLSDLVDSSTWKDEELKRFEALMCQLISPFNDNRGFKVFLSVDGQDIDLAREMKKAQDLAISKMVFEFNSHAIDLKVNIDRRKLKGNSKDGIYEKLIEEDNGEQFLSYFLSLKGSRNFSKGEGKNWLEYHISITPEQLETKNLINWPDDNPGPFLGEIYEYSFDRNMDDDSLVTLYESFTAYKKFIQNQLGVKIYRDGFAIRPYGIDGTDWIGLSKLQTSGKSFYGLRPGNIIGYVSIDEGVNPKLKDKTDREGLIENTYKRNFLLLLNITLDRVNECFEHLRRSYLKYKEKKADNNVKIKTTEEAFKAIRQVSESSEKITSQYKDVVAGIKEVERKINKSSLSSGQLDLFSSTTNQHVIEEIKQVLTEAREVLESANKVLGQSVYLDETISVLSPQLESMKAQLASLMQLASLGIISEMVSHELTQISDRLMGEATTVELGMKHDSTSSEMLYTLIYTIKTEVAAIRNQIKHLDSSMRYQAGKKEILSVASLMEDEKKFYDGNYAEKGIMIDVLTSNNFHIECSKGILIQVLDNLLNNSVYWLNNDYTNKDNKRQKRITILIDAPTVVVEDSGPGVDPDIESTMFDLFVTRKPIGKGRGLGLFIVKELLKADKCDIRLDSKTNEYGRKYRFVIDLNNITTER